MKAKNRQPVLNAAKAAASEKEAAKSNGGKPAAAGEKPAATLLPIVGIGASAGGLEAFMELLKHLPLDTGMGFVLVQHLDPQHESALTQLLTRATPKMWSARSDWARMRSWSNRPRSKS